MFSLPFASHCIVYCCIVIVLCIVSCLYFILYATRKAGRKHYLVRNMGTGGSFHKMKIAFMLKYHLSMCWSWACIRIRIVFMTPKHSIHSLKCTVNDSAHKSFPLEMSFDFMLFLYTLFVNLVGFGDTTQLTKIFYIIFYNFYF